MSNIRGKWSYDLHYNEGDVVYVPTSFHPIKGEDPVVSDLHYTCIEAHEKQSEFNPKYWTR